MSCEKMRPRFFFKNELSCEQNKTKIVVKTESNLSCDKKSHILDFKHEFKCDQIRQKFYFQQNKKKSCDFIKKQ